MPNYELYFRDVYLRCLVQAIVDICRDRRLLEDTKEFRAAIDEAVELALEKIRTENQK